MSVRAAGIVPMLAVFLCLPAGAAAGGQTRKKAIWGPVEQSGVPQFPIYKELGAGIYETGVNWAAAAPTRPLDPENPSDPAYAWPGEVDRAVAQAPRYGMKVAITLTQAPPWANGGMPENFAPSKPADFAAFATAASRRWPGVDLWLIWGEPSRKVNFEPLDRERRDRPLSARGRRGPALYARILDSAYGALKREGQANRVIGGNTFTTGDISPRNFISALRLPNGRPPRMDMYGHNPFGARKPDLRKPALGHGFADFSDLDDLAKWVDRGLGRGRHLPLFLSEYFVPTDHRNFEFNFHVTRQAQAAFLAAGLRITRRWRRIYTLGWFSLYDDPPRPHHDEVNRGLLDVKGRRKPAFLAFKRG